MEYCSKYNGGQLLAVCLAALIVPVFTAPCVLAHEQWFLTKYDKNISIYYRIRESGNVEFRGEVTLKASVSSCVAILRDVEAMPLWVYNVKQAKVLDKISEIEAYSYVVNTVPFPLTERDAVIHTMINQDPKTLAITIKGVSVPNYIAKSDDYVRIEEVNSYWQFTPLNKKSTKVVFQGFGEPGGNIPANVAHNPIFSWLVKTDLWKLPFYTLDQMKDQIKKEKYQNVSFDFLGH